MKIEFNKVTKLSQIVAIILFVSVFCLGLYLGKLISSNSILGSEISNVNFNCENNKLIHAIFYNNFVYIDLSNGPKVFLPHTISASGARYANNDESLVFWNKGNTAFVTEGNTTINTYNNCIVNN